MSHLLEQEPISLVHQEPQFAPETAMTAPVDSPPVLVAALEEQPGNPISSPNHHVEAGRKGGQRVHQLIQHGRLYEKEHGLKRGRQRLRQLIELGKVYEQEHGLRVVHGDTLEDRVARLSEPETLHLFLRLLLRLVKPGYRTRLLQTLQGSEEVGKSA